MPLVFIILKYACSSARCMKSACMLTAVVVALLLAGCSPSTQKGDLKMMKDTVVIETGKGTIEVQLNREKAPITVDNFLRYANAGFYDGTVFHRVMSGFMIQGGGFTPDGTQKPTNEPIKLESNNGLMNKMGTIAMARTPLPDSATSQFFINVADNGFLDYAAGNAGYAVFGNVTSGMDIVNKIAAVRTSNRGDNGNWPVEDVVIKRVYVKK